MIQGSGFGVYGLGALKGFWFKVQGLEFRIQVSGF
jgi:hypothetical protein